LGMVISESTYFDSSVMPFSAMSRRLLAFHAEGLGDHGDREDAEFLGDLRDDRRSTRAGAAAHAGGDEQHVGALDRFLDAIAVFHGRLPAEIRVGARAEPLGDVAADLDLRLHP
jgi:hypothetical protein